MKLFNEGQRVAFVESLVLSLRQVISDEVGNQLAHVEDDLAQRGVKKDGNDAFYTAMATLDAVVHRFDQGTPLGEAMELHLFPTEQEIAMPVAEELENCVMEALRRLIAEPVQVKVQQ